MLSPKIISFDNFMYYVSGKYLLGMLYNNIYFLQKFIISVDDPSSVSL